MSPIRDLYPATHSVPDEVQARQIVRAGKRAARHHPRASRVAGQRSGLQQSGDLDQPGPVPVSVVGVDRVRRSQVHTAHGPQIMAALGNLAITALRLAGITNIAGALRHHARDISRPLTTYKIT